MSCAILIGLLVLVGALFLVGLLPPFIRRPWH
jgi:hypothetical protein